MANGNEVIGANLPFTLRSIGTTTRRGSPGGQAEDLDVINQTHTPVP